MSSQKRVLILGSNSFAGATLVQHFLSAGHSVKGISRSAEKAPTHLIYRDHPQIRNFTFLQGDINFQIEEIIELLDSFKPQIIADLSGQGMVAESWLNPEQWFQTNVVSKIRIYEKLLSRSFIEKYIRFSTPEVYGNTENSVTEKAIYNPSTPYAVTHASVDLMLNAYANRYDFPSIIGRFANYYGPGQQLYRIIPKTILSILKDIKLPLQGGGRSERVFIQSADICTATQSMISHGIAGETYNFSSGEVVTIRDLVSRIANLMNVTLDSIVEEAPERPSKDFRYLMNSEKAKLDLGWAPAIDLDSGLIETVSWFQNNLSLLSRLPLDYEHRP
jgi:dTDP-glucose 4,6-dehydratase